MKNFKKGLRYSLYFLLCICLFGCNNKPYEYTLEEMLVASGYKKQYDSIMATAPQHIEYRNINDTIIITTSDGKPLTDNEKDAIRIIMDIDSLDIYWHVR